MIIQELHLSPFAGITRLNVDFWKGLNVVLGPNEAGKSTLVNALKMALFMATHYDKRTFEKEIANFIPLSGGDTIHVELAFSLGSHSYRLSKSWGKKKESSLTLPEGGHLTDPKTVQERLAGLLGLKEGTWNHVLFAFQSGLGSTLDSLSRNLSPVHDLSSILRKGFLETDGVSIEQLGKDIEKTFEDYFSHWDRTLGGPENNRGVENPYKKEVGKILGAYYKKEMLRQELHRALGYEREMDELNRNIQTLLNEISFLKEFVDQNRGGVEDARKRVILELEIKGLQHEEKLLREASLKWPAVEQELINIQENLGDLRKKEEHLKEEFRRVEAYESNKRRIEKFVRAERKKKELQGAVEILTSMKIIRKEVFQGLERLHNELGRLKTSLAAGKIDLTMTTVKPLELKLKKDFEEEISCSVTPGRPLALSAGGQIEIQHAEWTMNLKSGEADFEQVSARFNQVSREYQTLLQDLAVADFEEGRKTYESYKRQGEGVEALKRQLEETLEGETYEELEKQVGLAPQGPAYRSMAEIAKEIADIHGRLNQAERVMESGRKQLKEWETDYQSKEKLLDLLVEKRGVLNSRRENLENLKPLPEEIRNAEDFISDFEAKQKRLKEMEQDLAEKRISRAELEGGAPDETAEEIETRWKDAEIHFKKVKSEGKAVSEIHEVFLKIKQSMDEQTLDPWIAELQRVVAPLTLERYRRIKLGENGVGEAERTDGLMIPFHVLSMGTKVGLGLALRLSMARYFLQDSEGFLILDDPLVDMDPDRQQAAARVVRSFAEEKQVILLTCHPNHANLLGGNVITLK